MTEKPTEVQPPKIKTVWMIEEQVPGKIIWEGAYASKVQYTYKGVEYEVVVANDSFVGGGETTE